MRRRGGDKLADKLGDKLADKLGDSNLGAFLGRRSKTGTRRTQDAKGLPA